MHSFFDLVGFEYRKIFKRKGAVISLSLIVLFALLGPMGLFFGKVYVEGELIESNYQAMAKDRDYERALSGRSIDEALIGEVRDAYLKIPPVERNVSYVSIPEYQEYGRPYSGVYGIVYPVFGSNHRLMQNLTQEQIQNFYKTRHEGIAGEIDALRISDKSKENLKQLDSQIKTPLVFDYTESYEYFFSMTYTIGIFAAFAIAICLAPMFAGEYSARTDQLILASKAGKSKIITAKLFTGITFSAGACLIITILTYLVGSVFYGFDGAAAPVQLWWSFCVYPLTMWQTAVICSICVLFAAILVSAITMLLSSVFKSPFGVIIIVSVLLFVPMMLNVSNENVLLFNLFRLLPSNMMWIAMSIVDYLPYELFGLSIRPYVFMPVFAAVLSVVLLPFAQRAFRNHQIE